MASPDDSSVQPAESRNRSDRSLDVIICDVAEDPDQQKQVRRQPFGDLVSCASVADDDSQIQIGICDARCGTRGERWIEFDDRAAHIVSARMTGKSAR